MLELGIRVKKRKERTNEGIGREFFKNNFGWSSRERRLDDKQNAYRVDEIARVCLDDALNVPIHLILAGNFNMEDSIDSVPAREQTCKWLHMISHNICEKEQLLLT